MLSLGLKRCAVCRSCVLARPMVASKVRRHQECKLMRRKFTVVYAAEPSDADAASLAQTAKFDSLIDVLLSCTDQQQFTQTVAENVLSMNQAFWLRLAARRDTAVDEETKQKYSSLATTVMGLVDAMVKKTDAQISDSAAFLQDILRAGAEENGEWKLPLSAARVEAIKQAMDERAEYLDEGLLSNAFAWIQKSHEKGKDSMVQVLQKVLQIYAARQVIAAGGAQASEDDTILMDILAADPSSWKSMIRDLAEQGELSETSFTEAVQRKMENTVLGLESGSYAQRVQAEFLKELEDRGKAVFRDMAGV